MTAIATDAWALALAAVMSILISYTTFTLALRVSSARPRGGVCALLLSSLALGFGLWTANLVQVLSQWLTERPSVGVWLALPLAVAVSSQACALLFIAWREPDAAGKAGSAFALAVGIGATHWAMLDELPSRLLLRDGLPWLCGTFLFAFVTFLGGLSIWLKRQHDRSWQADVIRLLAALAGAIGILGINAQTLVHEEPALASRLMAASAAAQGYHCCPPQTAARLEAMLVDRSGTRTGLVAALTALVTREADT